MAIPSGQEAIGEVLNPRERPSPAAILARSEAYRPIPQVVVHRHWARQLLDTRGFAEVIASYQLGLPGLLLLPLGRCSG